MLFTRNAVIGTLLRLTPYQCSFIVFTDGSKNKQSIKRHKPIPIHVPKYYIDMLGLLHAPGRVSPGPLTQTYTDSLSVRLHKYAPAQVCVSLTVIANIIHHGVG